MTDRTAAVVAAIRAAEPDLTPTAREAADVLVAELQRSGGTRPPAHDLADTIERAWSNSPFREPTVVAKVEIAKLRRGG